MMVKIKTIGRYLYTTIYCIIQDMRLADIFLLIFMSILMIQSVCNLFHHELHGNDSGTIDVIVRTTAAGIFGYFIGAGFLRDDLAAKDRKIEIPTNAPRSSRSSPPEITPPESLKTNLAKQQTIIVAIIGIFSLLVLGAVNSYCSPSLSTSASATVSQLRDFVSGSVGLLIGNSARKTS